MRINSKQFSEFVSVVKLLSKSTKDISLYNFKIMPNNTIEIQAMIGSYHVLKVFQGIEDSFEEFTEVTVSGLPIDKFEPDTEEVSIVINSSSVFINLGSITLNAVDKYGSKYLQVLGSFDETNSKPLKSSITGLLATHKSLNAIARENLSSYHFMKNSVLLYQSVSATVIPFEINFDIEFSLPFRVMPAFIEAYANAERIIKLDNSIVLFSKSFAFVMPFNEVTNFSPLITSEEVAFLEQPEVLARHLKQNQKEMFDLTFDSNKITYSAVLTDIDVMIQGFINVKCKKTFTCSVKAAYLASLITAHSSPLKLSIMEDTLVLTSNKMSYLSVVR